MKQERDWPRVWTAQIGRALARHRKLKGISAAALSARTAELGFEIPRNTITNLENGRKEAVPIHEVVVLALALGVAPFDLIFPAALGQTVMSRPSDQPVDTVLEGLWFTGLNHDSEFYVYQLLMGENELLGHVNSILSQPDREDDLKVRSEAAGVAQRFEAHLKLAAARGLPLPELSEGVQWWLDPDPLGAPNYQRYQRYLPERSDG